MTLEELREKWNHRDSQYAESRERLSRSMIDAAREWRFMEAREIEGPSRTFALGIVATWEPPRPKPRMNTW